LVHGPENETPLQYRAYAVDHLSAIPRHDPELTTAQDGYVVDWRCDLLRNELSLLGLIDGRDCYARAEHGQGRESDRDAR
jgi:hypothetical protein